MSGIAVQPGLQASHAPRTSGGRTYSRRPRRVQQVDLAPFIIAGEVLSRGGDVSALVAALEGHRVGRVGIELPSPESYPNQVRIYVPHPDDEAHVAELALAGRSSVRLTSHGEAGEQKLEEGVIDERHRPEVMGPLRDREFLAATAAVKARGEFAYPHSVDSSLDYRYELDPLAVAQEWSRRMGVNPMTGLSGISRLIYDEVLDLRKERPLVAVAFHEDGDPHHGPKSHGHHRLAGRISHAATLIAAMEIDGLPVPPYRVPMAATITPQHHPDDLLIPADWGARALMLDEYPTQFDQAARREFLGMSERLSFDRAAGALPVDRQRELVQAILAQAA